MIERSHTSAQQDAYRHIRKQILSGAVSSGFHLKPSDIARALSISPMPVRDALRQLEAEGLVCSRPNRGVVVASLTPDEIEELVELRAELEALVVRHAIPVLTDEALDELELLTRRMERASGDPEVWIERHLEFHHAIIAASNKRQLASLLIRILNQLQPYTWQWVQANFDAEMAGHEHKALLEALRSRNVEAAVEMARGHALNFGVTLTSFLEQRMRESRAARGRHVAL